MGEERCATCGAVVEDPAKGCPVCGPSADATAAFAPVESAEQKKPATTVTIGGGPALMVSKGPDSGERFVLSSDVVTVGRDPASDIFLNDITVSRRHARIERTRAGFTLADVGSLNGTYVNGERIESHILDAGDEVQIGKFRLIYSL